MSLSATDIKQPDAKLSPQQQEFFKKLRALSKNGIALPAVAGLVGIGTLSGKKDDKKLDNIE